MYDTTDDGEETKRKNKSNSKSLVRMFAGALFLICYRRRSLYIHVDPQPHPLLCFRIETAAEEVNPQHETRSLALGSLSPPAASSSALQIVFSLQVMIDDVARCV